MQVVTTSDGVLVEFYIHASAKADSTGLRAMASDMPEGGVLYTDADYTDTDYVGEDLFEKATGNRQQPARKTANGLTAQGKSI